MIFAPTYFLQTLVPLRSLKNEGVISSPQSGFDALVKLKYKYAIHVEYNYWKMIVQIQAVLLKNIFKVVVLKSF